MAFDADGPAPLVQEKINGQVAFSTSIILCLYFSFLMTRRFTTNGPAPPVQEKINGQVAFSTSINPLLIFQLLDDSKIY